MEATTGRQEARGPGRPSTGARERVLEAGLETLLEEGYAGLTYARVAVRAGENKSLISYYFCSKQGLVGAVSELVGDRITAGVLVEIEGSETVGELVEGMVTGLWNVMDADQRIARLYFDLSAVSVVDEDVRRSLHLVKDRWREVISGYLAVAGVPRHRVPAAATFLVAGVEGLAIERLEGYEPERLEEASKLFIRSAALAL
ncbi:MAG TPA: TetR/AcrR family transcriptional regulator [Solirubrobacterales bacterium]|nr:TetR/AcrR family transcriptional regulator [Solirubrobacterales bacterium]